MSANAVTAIVVSYHTGPILGDCLKALAGEAVGEVILVNNGNPDGAVEAAVAAMGREVRILTGHGNIGFAAACNLGAKAATGEYLLFLNPDAIMDKGGVSQLLADSKDLARPWLMGALLLNPDGKEQRGSRRVELTPWRVLFEAAQLAPLAPLLLPSFNRHRTPRPDSVVEMPTLSGACLFLPAADYAALSGMDEGYFLHVEDIDFCKRFRDAGGRVWFNPHVEITHHKSSSAAPVREVEAHKTRSLIRYFDVHFDKSWPGPARWLLARLLWISYALKTAGKN